MPATQDLIAAIVAQIETALPPLLAAAGLPAITGVLAYDPAVPVPAQAPLVWVDIAGARRSDDVERGASIRKYAYSRTILVGAMVAGETPASVATRLQGISDCVRQAVEKEQTYGGKSLWCRWLTTDYDVPMAAGNAIFREVVQTYDLPTRIAHGTE